MLNMSIEELVTRVNSTKEVKTYSGSGGYYGLYWALLNFPFTFNIIVLLINKCLENIFLLKRWKKIIQMMLCKSPRNYDIEKHFVPQIIEVDLILYLRFLWRKRLVSDFLNNNLYALK